MAIPKYEELMLPLLKFYADQKEHAIRDAFDHLANIFNLSNEERQKLLPSGKEPVLNNRARWARLYMKKAGLLLYTNRGYSKITERGLEVLGQNPKEINTKFLSQFPEFRGFKESSSGDSKSGVATLTEVAEQQTPEELLESAHQSLTGDLAQELLDAIGDCSPAFFERLVIELLIKMGYGGSRKDAGQAIGQSGDGGIDGIIKEDKLGLDVIYIQAKRWRDGTVGRPAIQGFVGALAGKQAKKGIFITTSTFSREAREYANTVDSKVILIDGAELAQLMIDHNVGVNSVAAYEVKKIDSDYFTED